MTTTVADPPAPASAVEEPTAGLDPLPRTTSVTRTDILEHVQLALRDARPRRRGALAVVSLDAGGDIAAQHGSDNVRRLAEQLAQVLRTDSGVQESVGVDEAGRLLVLMPHTRRRSVERRLRLISDAVAASRQSIGGEPIRVTPVIGWVALADATGARVLHRRAAVAADTAALHLDLLPLRWTREMHRRVAPRRRSDLRERLAGLRGSLTLPAQIAATTLLGLGLPFVTYVALFQLGIDVSQAAYWLVAGSLVVTAFLLLVESLHALDPLRPPDEPGAPHPTATAVIAAYLPNESGTIMETVDAFRRLDYPGPLQILVTYNTPYPMPVEDDLAELAARDPRVVPLPISTSTSKAQNVNAALAHVEGEFVGVFDADHHPHPTAFRRAWRWLSNGYDVVQGHCVIRNGDASPVARMVAVEFESIYAVSHPGRARLHGFGLFGGSNGYWRTDLLARTRMHGSMLTEDIDSTLRILGAGSQVASDPALISRELAPETWSALWKQRARWAQGWFQVSTKHLARTWRSSHLGVRQKLGMTFLLGWREVYAWLSFQLLPVLAFTAYRDGSVAALRWAIPALLLMTLFTTSVGPLQTLFAKRLAVPELRNRKGWFWRYLFVSSIFYTEWKNVVTRVAHLKELVGERHWNVTPRSSSRTSRGLSP